jgi:hypothetical protein
VYFSGQVAPAAESFCVSMGKPAFQQAPVHAFNAPQQKQLLRGAAPMPAAIRREAPVLRRQATGSNTAAAATPASTSFSLSPLPTNAANPKNPSGAGSFIAVAAAVLAVGL